MTPLAYKSRNIVLGAVPGLSVPVGTKAPETNVRTGPWPDAAEDQVLLARVARQDRLAFNALVERHLGAVLTLARRMLRDDAEAEDVAQETMLRLWRAGERLDLGTHGLRPWLRRVAANLCVDRVRAAKGTVLTDEVPETPEPPTQLEHLEQRDIASRVGAAMHALPERQRLALTLFHHEGMSQIEIAEIMGISDEAVESLLARARRALKVSLEAEWKALLAKDGA